MTAAHADISRDVESRVDVAAIREFNDEVRAAVEFNRGRELREKRIDGQVRAGFIGDGGRAEDW